jgi:hypothetical protein
VESAETQRVSGENMRRGLKWRKNEKGRRRKGKESKAKWKGRGGTEPSMDKAL